MDTFLTSILAQEAASLCLPRYRDLPTLDLYMDQVLCVVNGALAPLNVEPKKPFLTPTMINNYVKQKVVTPPNKKRYTRDHLVHFMIVALLKNVYSIAEITDLLHNHANSFIIAPSYDYFCDELESALNATFSTRLPYAICSRKANQSKTELLHSVITSLVHKIYVEKYLAYSHLEKEQEVAKSVT